MDQQAELAFLHELRGQCQYAFLAHGAMLDSQRAYFSGSNDQGIVFWAAVQSLLAAVANLSKLLYPGTSAESLRGAHLRDLVTEALALPFNVSCRGVRNSLEHIDERISRWGASATRGKRVDYNFAAAGTLESEHGKENCFRNFDANAGVLTFMGEDFQVPPVLLAIRELCNKVENLIATRHG
jgi:hypothetical protein